MIILINLSLAILSLEIDLNVHTSMGSSGELGTRMAK